MSIVLTASFNDDQRRLDRILRKALPGLPLSALHRLLRTGKITINNNRAFPGDRIRAGQIIIIEDLPLNSEIKTESPYIDSGARLINERIIFEGCGLLVLNKPAGITVHGPDSLDNMVTAYLGPKTGPSL